MENVQLSSGPTQPPSSWPPKRIRFKEYQCTYPGCSEGPKTKYNCLSHIWDVHLKPLAGINESFKSIQSRENVKESCMAYVRFIPNEAHRKRRPYDLSDRVINTQPDLVSPIANSPVLRPSQSFAAESVSSAMPDETLFSPAPLFAHVPPPCFPSQTLPPTHELLVNPIIPELVNNNEEFIRIYSINEKIKRLHVAGQIFAENGFFQRSDRRMKTNIRTIQHALSKLLAIEGKSYCYVNDETVRYGFIAQELREVLPEAVIEDERGLSIDALTLVPFIVEALKELIRELEAVKQTQHVASFTSDAKSTLSVVCSVTDFNTVCLGPPSYVVPIAMVLSILSAVLSVTTTFPFLWIYLVFCSVCFWTSHQYAPNGTFSPTALALNFVLLNVGLVFVAVTFLMGSILQTFLGIYLALLLLLWGMSQITRASFFNFFLVLFAFSCVACWSFGMLQPTFECSVSTPMEHGTDFATRLIYTNPEDVRFQLDSQLPWNCFDPKLVAVGNRTVFTHKDNPLEVSAVDPQPFDNFVVLSVSCSGIKHRCQQFSVVRASNY